MAQAGQLFPMEALVRSQASPFGIYCGQTSTVTGFPLSISVFVCQYYSTNALYSFIYPSPTLCDGSRWLPRDLFLLCTHARARVRAVCVWERERELLLYYRGGLGRVCCRQNGIEIAVSPSNSVLPCVIPPMLRTYLSIYNRRHWISAVDCVFKSDTKTPKICAR
jgi:hypothetical protein